MATAKPARAIPDLAYQRFKDEIDRPENEWQHDILSLANT
jgi:hypothetical protein